MISYFLIGLVWGFWLEFYTSSTLGLEWTLRERIFHICLWPVSLGIFLKEFFKNL